uniref:F-box domain-containing protein n=1 Tax=Panagrellus redivivus TaxID=6233 RepID=A0A7E4VPM1_PANRE
MCRPTSNVDIALESLPDDAHRALGQAMLRPHLLLEIFDILIPKHPASLVQPDTICKFIVASQETLKCVYHLLRYRFNRIYHQGCRPDKTLLLSNKANISILFTEELHVKSLLNFSGKVIQEIMNSVTRSAWLSPFFDGLRSNTSLTALNTCAGYGVFYVYADSHETFPPVYTNAFHLAHIETYRRLNHYDITQIDQPEKLEELVILGDARSTMHLVPVLEIKLSHLKKLTLNAKLRYYGAIRVLRNLDSIPNIIMNDVIFPKPRALINLNRTLEITRFNFDTMWKAIQRHPGFITVVSVQEGSKRGRNENAHNLIISYFSDLIVERSITSKSCCFKGLLKRSSGKKSLTLQLVIHWCY